MTIRASMPRFKLALRRAQDPQSEEGGVIAPKEREQARAAAAVDFMLETRNLEGINVRLQAAGIEPLTSVEAFDLGIQQLQRSGGPARQIADAARNATGDLKYLDVNGIKDSSGELVYPATLLPYDLMGVLKEKGISPLDPNYATRISQFEDSLWQEAHSVLAHDLHGILLVPMQSANERLANQARNAYQAVFSKPRFQSEVDASSLSAEDKALLKQLHVVDIKPIPADGSWELKIQVEGTHDWHALQEAFERFASSLPYLSWTKAIRPWFTH